MKLIQDFKPKIYPTKNKATHHQPPGHLFYQAQCYSLVRFLLCVALLSAWAESGCGMPVDSLRNKPLFSLQCILSGESWCEADLTLIPQIVPFSIFLAPSSWLALPWIHPISAGESANSDDLLKLFTQDHGWLNNFLEASPVLKTKLRTF